MWFSLMPHYSKGHEHQTRLKIENLFTNEEGHNLLRKGKYVNIHIHKTQTKINGIG